MAAPRAVGTAAGARRIVGASTVVVAMPLVVGVIALRTPRWYPVADMAQIEMRVRDVPSHPPLLGPVGRLLAYGHVGSHPGPLGFYLLWPVYVIFGRSAWALQVSSVVLTLVAVGLAVWIGRRRGGTAGAVAVTAALIVLLRAYGAGMVAEPWNPNLPVAWWVVLLLAAWSVLVGDLALLPVVALAGSLCAQTHVAYLPLVGAVWALTLIAVVAHRRSWRLVLGSLGLVVLLWAPVILEQITHHPGNLAILVETMRHPIYERVPHNIAVGMWWQHLDVFALATGDDLGPASDQRGQLFLATWAATALLACWRRAWSLAALHAVAAVALVVGYVATIHITGPLWLYLIHWLWGTTTVMALAAAWTLAAEAQRVELPDDLAQGAVAGLAAAVIAAAGLFTVEARNAERTNEPLSAALRHLTPPLLDRLRDEPAGSRYFVSWSETLTGYGLLLELERHGVAAGVDPSQRLGVRPHRVLRKPDADAEIHLATGADDIRRWRHRRHAHLVAAEHQPGEPPKAIFLLVL